MKLLDPIIYVVHKVDGEWAKSAFQFTGLVDKRRVKREIIAAFKRGGQKVSPKYIEAAIMRSLSVPKTVEIKLNSQPIALPDDTQTTEDN